MIRLLVALSFVVVACEYGDMPLPTSREETATPASPVSSNTINAIQDAIIGAKRGPRWRKIAGAAGMMAGATQINDLDYFSNWTHANGWAQFTAVDQWRVYSLDLMEGERLLAVKAIVSCGVTDVLEMTPFRLNPGAAATPFGSDLSVGHIDAVEDLLVSGLTEIVTDASNFYAVQFKVTAFGSMPVIYGIMYQTDTL